MRNVELTEEQVDIIRIVHNLHQEEARQEVLSLIREALVSTDEDSEAREILLNNLQLYADAINRELTLNRLPSDLRSQLDTLKTYLGEDYPNLFSLTETFIRHQEQLVTQRATQKRVNTITITIAAIGLVASIIPLISLYATN